MKTIIFATGNKDKMREIREIMADVDVEVLSMKEAGIAVDVVEDGVTFEENSLLKARAIAEHTDAIVLADDSGLEIDAFGRQPGVQSARWLGHETPYSEKNRIILEKMQGIENRTCRYVCAIAITRPGEEPVVFEDTVECTIAYEPSGENGFGYDPIIFYPPYHKTMADMDKDEKNAISHRGKAVRKLEEWLENHA
jgi:XTP/dITP diphosphohydrolase